MKRPTKDFYYLGIAEAVSRRSTCLNKRWGSVIVKNDRIIATGYNGAPTGTPNCCDAGKCARIEAQVQRGTDYLTCPSSHSEVNAIISARREDMLNSTLYIYGYDVVRNTLVDNPSPCAFCRRQILNAGITTIVVADPRIGIPSADPDVDYRARVIHAVEYHNLKSITSAY